MPAEANVPGCGEEEEDAGLNNLEQPACSISHLGKEEDKVWGESPS